MRPPIAVLAALSLLSLGRGPFSTTTTTQAMAASLPVPKQLHPTALMKDTAKWLSTARLVPIDFAPSIGDLVRETTDSTVAGTEAVATNAGKAGSICFVVRRPGWVLCREHGQQLSELAAESTTLDGFDLFGVVKETGVDDEGLRVFHKDHFPYPLYRDENLDFYRAFGDGKITDHMSLWSLLNPYRIYKGMKGMGKRMKSKNLTGNYVGEGLKTGGIIVFGSDGEPKYAYAEITGSALEVDDLVAAIQDVRNSGDRNEL